MTKEFGWYLLLGLLLGSIFGLILSASETPDAANLGLGVLAGVSAGLSVSSSGSR